VCIIGPAQDVPFTGLSIFYCTDMSVDNISYIDDIRSACRKDANAPALYIYDKPSAVHVPVPGTDNNTWINYYCAQSTIDSPQNLKFCQMFRVPIDDGFSPIV
jgi:hypothetical protein